MGKQFLLLVDGLFAVAQQAGQILDLGFEVGRLELLVRPLTAQGIEFALRLLERGFRRLESLVPEPNCVAASPNTRRRPLTNCDLYVNIT